MFLSWHSVTASLHSGIIWAHAWCFMFNFPLCPSSMNTKQLDFCQQWWHTSSFINNWEYQLPMNKSSKETWIFKLFLFSLVFFFWFFPLSCSLSWAPNFLSGKTKCVHTFFCFLFSVSMLTCKIIKNSQKAEGILTGTDLDHTWEHTEKWNGIYCPFPRISSAPAAESSRKRIPLCACGYMHYSACQVSFPWVTKTWVRQNWNESITRHWSNLCSRGLELSFLGAERGQGGRNFVRLCSRVVEWWKKLSGTLCCSTKLPKDEDWRYCGWSPVDDPYIHL